MKLSTEIFGDEQLASLFKGIEDQVPFASALTLTRTAKDIQGAGRGHLRGALDRPISRTVQSVRIQPATKRKLEAYVWITDEAHKGTPPQTYLEAQIGGGTRRAKRHEVALRKAGILPEGWYTVPGKDAKLNRYGNLSGATYVKILSAIKAFGEQGYAMNRSSSKRSQRKKRRANYFVMKKEGRPIGIYQRTGKRTVKSILHFVSNEPTYAPRVHFTEVGLKVVDRRLRQHAIEALEQALRTAGQKSPRTSRKLLPPSPRARVF